MELILFIGIQATGKSSFYRERFFSTHVRVNLDMLKTRRREALLVTACLVGKTPFVVDNTNLTREERARYIAAAKAKQFAVHGYFFQSRSADALARNAARTGTARVPDLAIRGASRRLDLPSAEEGFDSLQFVRLEGPDQFIVEEWKHEV
ncbi:MAG: AAA family ATPase [Limisphaerales bacterium]